MGWRTGIGLNIARRRNSENRRPYLDGLYAVGVRDKPYLRRVAGSGISKKPVYCIVPRPEYYTSDIMPVPDHILSETLLH